MHEPVPNPFKPGDKVRRIGPNFRGIAVGDILEVRSTVLYYIYLVGHAGRFLAKNFTPVTSPLEVITSSEIAAEWRRNVERQRTLRTEMERRGFTLMYEGVSIIHRGFSASGCVFRKETTPVPVIEEY